MVRSQREPPNSPRFTLLDNLIGVLENISINSGLKEEARR